MSGDFSLRRWSQIYQRPNWLGRNDAPLNLIIRKNSENHSQIAFATIQPNPKLNISSPTLRNIQ